MVVLNISIGVCTAVAIKIRYINRLSGLRSPHQSVCWLTASTVTANVISLEQERSTQARAISRWKSTFGSIMGTATCKVV